MEYRCGDHVCSVYGRPATPIGLNGSDPATRPRRVRKHQKPREASGPSASSGGVPWLHEATGERRAVMRHLLLHAQAWWDAQRFDQPVWQVAAWRDQKVRHIHLHVAKALGKVVAALGEEARTTSGTDLMARVRDEVLPDVAIYRSQLSNLFPDVGAPPALRGDSAGDVGK